MDAPAPVILFDGECGLCNRVVRLLLKWDARGRMRFSPLQGVLAQAYLRDHGLPRHEFSSVVFVPDWDQRKRPDFRVRTGAVVAALRICGGMAALLGWMLWLIPSPARDLGYRSIGALRYRIFGPWRSCPLPRPEWRARILE